jgi:hypothetical protein
MTEGVSPETCWATYKYEIIKLLHLVGFFFYKLYYDARIHQQQVGYIGCPRRNVPNFRRVSLMLKYTDITQNTYLQSWTVTEIIAREKWGLLAVPRAQLTTLTIHCACPSLRVSLLPTSWLRYERLISSTESAVQSEMEVVHVYARTHLPCKVLGTLRMTAALMWMFM